MTAQLFRRAGRLAVVVALTGTSCWPATAQALTPPTVDAGQLPPSAAPAPPEPSAQRAACVATAGLLPTVTDPLRALDLAALWSLSRGAGQRVAVIDTGVNRHARLARVEPGGDYVGYGDGTQDCDAHGTIVAGIIAAAADPKDPSGFAGIAPEATVLSIRQSSMVFGPADDPARVGFGDVDTMAAAVRTAADAGATVINISSVACAAGPLHDAALGAALAYAVDTRDVVVVAAAGNAGGANQCPPQAAVARLDWQHTTVAVSPAWYDDYVLTVGSISPDGAPSAFSLAGPWVDVAAPGEQMISLDPGGTGTTDRLGTDRPISGTSYAAPVVSGLAALVRARFPELTARQVMQRIEDTAQHRPGGWDPAVGNGVIDPAAALTLPPAGPAEAVAAPALPEQDARRVALLGVAGCCGILTLALAAMNIVARSRQSPDDPADPDRDHRQHRAT